MKKWSNPWKAYLYPMKNLIFIALLLLSGTKIYSQSNNSLLWEINGKDLKSPSYLFGTYHLITSTFIDSFPVIQNRFSVTGNVIGEMVLTTSMTQKLMEAAIMKDSTLDQLMSKEDYKIVGDYLMETSGYSISLFNKMKPVLVGTLFYKAEITPGDTGKPMDLYFQEMAKRDGKLVSGLESMDEQLGILFNNTSLKRQAEVLVKTAKEKDKSAAVMSKMNNCYRAGNLDCLAESIQMEEEYTKEEMDKLLYSRNRAWIKLLPLMMKEQSCFIAVGAGHLPGKEGLIELLRGAGYSVKPVSLK
jgi:uncharacterized protein YbaP (TraB family)